MVACSLPAGLEVLGLNNLRFRIPTHVRVASADRVCEGVDVLEEAQRFREAHQITAGEVAVVEALRAAAATR